MYAIELEGVSKRFGGKLALENVSLRVDKGSSVLLVGTNGAGKSTLLRCVLGIIGFTGSITVHGLDVRRHGKEVRRMVGYVPQNVRFSENATVEYVVDYVSDLKGVDVYLEEVLAPLGLDKMAGARVGSLSGGMRQRAQLARALITSPKLLVMDEPFVALDALTRIKLQGHLSWLISKLRSTVIFITHDIEEAITIGTRIIVMSRRPGTIKASIAVEEPHPRDPFKVRASGYSQDLKEKLLELLSGEVTGYGEG